MAGTMGLQIRHSQDNRTGAASPPRAAPLSGDELRDSVVIEVEDDADMDAVALGLFARGVNRRLMAMIAAARVVAETEVDAWRVRVAVHGQRGRYHELQRHSRSR